MNLIPSFGHSLYDAWADPAIDTLEFGIDNVLDNPMLESLPLIKYFVAAGKTALAIRDKFFISKTMKFISEFHQQTVDEGEISRRKTALEAKEDWIFKELEFLVLTLERTDRAEKTKILSEIYHDYLCGKIKKLLFEDYCSIIERLFLMDILQLRADYEAMIEEEQRKLSPPTECYVYSHAYYIEQQGRLLSLGLLTASAKTHPQLTTNENLLKYELSYRGKQYAEILSRIDFLGISSEIFRE